MENQSLWVSPKKQFSVLQSDIDCDVCVIGGGIAGITAAYALSKKGYKVVVLEAKTICSGQTQNSSAVLSYAQDIVYSRLIKLHGMEVAQKYLLSTIDAIQQIAKIVDDEGIECGLSSYDQVLYSTTKKGAKQILKEKEAYQSLGHSVEFVSGTELPFATKNAILLKGQAAFNPYEYTYGLAQAVEKNKGQIFENAFVRTQPKENMLTVNGYAVKAKYFVVATHYPYINAPGFYFIKMYQSRSYNMIINNTVNLRYVCESAEDNGFEYRPVEGGKLLVGGANVRCGRYSYQSKYREVEQHISQHFEGQKPQNRFSAQDCLTFDLLPLCGEYSQTMKNVFVISGFNKWGMTNSFLCAQILCDLIEKNPRAQNIFDPHRPSFLKCLKDNLINSAVVLNDFLIYFFNPDSKKLKRIQKGQGAIVRIKGKRIGVYRDQEGKLHAIKAVCTHLKGALKWNKDELSWDCPCHGSRFDIDGNIIDNPALENAQKAKADI